MRECQASKNQVAPLATSVEAVCAPKAVHVGTRPTFNQSFAPSAWAEVKARAILSQPAGLATVCYGASRTQGEEEDKKEYARHIAATKEHGKRPDLLCFDIDTYRRLANEHRLPDGRAVIDCLEGMPDADIPYGIVQEALAAVEIEYSGHKCLAKPGYGKVAMRPGKCKPSVHERWNGVRFGKSATVATLFLKVGDVEELERWKGHFDVPLLFAQFFHDACFLFDLRIVRAAARDKVIIAENYRYGEGAKRTWRVPYTFGVPLADILELPEPCSIGYYTPNGKWDHATEMRGGKFSISDRAETMVLQAREGSRVTRPVIETLTSPVTP